MYRPSILFLFFFLLYFQSKAQIKFQTFAPAIRYVVDEINFEYQNSPYISTFMSYADHLFIMQIVNEKTSLKKAELQKISETRFWFAEYDSTGESIRQGELILSNIINNNLDTIATYDLSGNFSKFIIQPYKKLEKNGIWTVKPDSKTFWFGNYKQNKKDGEWVLFNKYNLPEEIQIFKADTLLEIKTINKLRNLKLNITTEMICGKWCDASYQKEILHKMFLHKIYKNEYCRSTVNLACDGTLFLFSKGFAPSKSIGEWNFENNTLSFDFKKNQAKQASSALVFKIIYLSDDDMIIEEIK